MLDVGEMLVEYVHIGPSGSSSYHKTALAEFAQAAPFEFALSSPGLILGGLCRGTTAGATKAHARSEARAEAMPRAFEERVFLKLGLVLDQSMHRLLK